MHSWLIDSSAMLCVLCMTHSLLVLQDDKTAWVQLTVKIPSEQSFAAYSAKKSLVAGNPDKAIKVEDTWVFERALKKDPTTRSGPVKQAIAYIMHHLTTLMLCLIAVPMSPHMLLFVTCTVPICQSSPYVTAMLSWMRLYFSLPVLTHKMYL